MIRGTMRRESHRSQVVPSIMCCSSWGPCCPPLRRPPGLTLAVSEPTPPLGHSPSRSCAADHHILMLMRRFPRLEELIERLEEMTPASPTRSSWFPPHPSSRVERLAITFRASCAGSRTRPPLWPARSSVRSRRTPPLCPRTCNAEVNQALTARFLLHCSTQRGPHRRSFDIRQAAQERLSNQAMKSCGPSRQLGGGVRSKTHDLSPRIEASRSLSASRRLSRRRFTPRGLTPLR